jgi:dTMP kinase
VLIAFEGGEGTGKSTQARLLAARIGDGAIATHEPGGTAVGRAIRALLLDLEPGPAGLDARAEALLMAADRAQHVAEVIAPALAAGRIVVTDRYVGSSLAYQGRGRGLGMDAVAALSDFATVGVEADLVLWLRVSPQVRDARMAVRGRAADRLERESSSFHDRVDAGFAALAAADRRWVLLDGEGDEHTVAERVWAVVAPRLPRHL